MADTHGQTVILLERDRFYFYDGGNILTLAFPQNICYDLDVKDRDQFFNLVTTFIQNSKLEPAQIFMVLADPVCFSKDFPIKDPANTVKAEDDAQAFIDAVPFNAVLSRVYKTPNVLRVVATNQELVDTIVDAFIAKGFGLTALVPSNIYPEYGAARELTEGFAKHIISTEEQAKISSMVGEKSGADDHEVNTSVSKEPKSKLLPYLLIGFAVLLVILVVVVVTRK